MVHFSLLQGLFVTLLVLLTVGLVTWLVWLAGRGVPPRLTSEGKKSGFSGSLLILTASLVFFFLYWVVLLAVDAAQAYRAMQYGQGISAAAALAPLAPDVLFVALFLFVVVRLAVGRAPRVPAETAALVWVLGPIASVASKLFFSAALDPVMLVTSIIYAAAVSLYLATSDRVALTYGTKRARSKEA